MPPLHASRFRCSFLHCLGCPVSTAYSRICTEVRCLPAVTRAVVAPTPTMGGSAPGRAVLLSPMLREIATSLLWVCAFPRRNAILLLLYVHISVSDIYACLPTPAMGGSAPGRAVLLSPMLKETATCLLWVCAFPRRNVFFFFSFYPPADGEK